MAHERERVPALPQHRKRLESAVPRAEPPLVHPPAHPQGDRDGRFVGGDPDTLTDRPDVGLDVGEHPRLPLDGRRFPPGAERRPLGTHGIGDRVDRRPELIARQLVHERAEQVEDHGRRARHSSASIEYTTMS